LNLIPEEDEDKLKTMYGSSKRFFDNSKLENILRISFQKDLMQLEKKEIPSLKGEKSKIKFTKTIRLRNQLNTTEDLFADKFKSNIEITNLSKTINSKPVIKKSSSVTEEKLTNNIFDFSKPPIHKNTNQDVSPNLNYFFEEDSTKFSNKATPDNTRFTPNSIRSERSNSRQKYTPPDSAKLPSINTTRSKKDYDLNGIIDVANDFKEDPVIKKKLNDIYQNIADIKKVLDQRAKNRVKVLSAPVGVDDTNDQASKVNKLVNNRVVNTQIKLKLTTPGNIVKALEKDKFPIKVVKK
jgi:hypothetical protein